MPSPALFLDRDGIINVDHGYVHRVDQFELIPGIFELVRFATGELGWPVIVITNQAGIGRNYYDEAAYQTLTRWIYQRFERENAPLTRIYHCPYHPEHGIGKYRADHPWRKPKPGMILQAASDFDLDLPASVLIGDTMSDIEAGAAAGIAWRIRVDAARNPAGESTPPHDIVCDLKEALGALRGRLAPAALPAASSDNR